MAVVVGAASSRRRLPQFTVRSPRLLLRDCVYQPLELLDPISGDAEIDAAEVQLVIGLEGGSVRPAQDKNSMSRFGLAS